MSLTTYSSCEIHLDYIHGRNEYLQPWVPRHAFDAFQTELTTLRHYRQQCRGLESANKHCHEHIAQLEAALHEICGHSMEKGVVGIAECALGLTAEVDPLTVARVRIDQLEALLRESRELLNYELRERVDAALTPGAR